MNYFAGRLWLVIMEPWVAGSIPASSTNAGVAQLAEQWFSRKGISDPNPCPLLTSVAASCVAAIARLHRYMRVRRQLIYGAGYYCIQAAHRRKRHHEAGIAEIMHKWGPKAAEAARQHIMADLKQVGWTGPFPLNERHCERMGLWVTR